MVLIGLVAKVNLLHKINSREKWAKMYCSWLQYNIPIFSFSFSWVNSQLFFAILLKEGGSSIVWNIISSIVLVKFLSKINTVWKLLLSLMKVTLCKQHKWSRVNIVSVKYDALWSKLKNMSVPSRQVFLFQQTGEVFAANEDGKLMVAHQ